MDKELVKRFTDDVFVPSVMPSVEATAAVVTPVIKPFPLTVNTGIEVELPNVPVLEFTVASVKAVDTLLEPSIALNVAVASPVNATLIGFNQLLEVAALPETVA